MDLKKQRW